MERGLKGFVQGECRRAFNIFKMMFVFLHHKTFRFFFFLFFSFHLLKVVLAAVRIQGVALQFADPVLQADPSVVSVAVAQNGIALNYARLRANESIVHGQSVQEALKWREVVLVAAAQDGHALWAAPELLQDDREVKRETNEKWNLEH